jgi:hypothetical protein
MPKGYRQGASHRVFMYLDGGWHVAAVSDPAPAHRYRVYLPERQGQGGTLDRDGPVACQSIADATTAFFEP